MSCSEIAFSSNSLSYFFYDMFVTLDVLSFKSYRSSQIQITSISSSHANIFTYVEAIMKDLIDYG